MSPEKQMCVDRLVHTVKRMLSLKNSGLSPLGR